MSKSQLYENRLPDNVGSPIGQLTGLKETPKDVYAQLESEEQGKQGTSTKS